MASRAGQLSGGQRQVATMPGSGCTHQDLPTWWPTEHGWGWQCLQPKASPKLPALDSDRVPHPGGGADICSPMQSPAGSCLCIGTRGLLVRTQILPAARPESGFVCSLAMHEHTGPFPTHATSAYRCPGCTGLSREP